MRKILCDRCGADLSKEERVGHIVIGYKDVYQDEEGITVEPIRSEYSDMDFCDNCIKEIEQVIAKKEIPVSIMNDSTENKQSKTKKEPQSSIDIGKVMALRNAGWKIKDIAGEMGKDPHSISQAIYKHKKTNGEKDEERNGSVD